MIADTIFVSDLLKERRKNKPGPATALFGRHRSGIIRTTIITAGELAVLFPANAAAWQWLGVWKIYQLHRGVVEAAADLDRHLKARGIRLGENDNWIAGFTIYFRQPIISNDADFDRVPGIRRIAY